MMNSVLLVENQITQFRLISECLKKRDFSVLPEENDFSVFLSWLRIALNNRYKAQRQKEAKQKIYDYVNENNVALAIIDHNLIGMALSAEDGVDLAIGIRSNTHRKDLPILFLSRTRESDESVMRKLRFFSGSKYEWITKGYDADVRLTPKYIDKEVVPRLHDLIEGGDPYDRFSSLMNRLVSDAGLEDEDFFERLKELAHIEPNDLTDEHIDFAKTAENESKRNGGLFKGSEVEAALRRFRLYG